jgi:hypothetical protein
VQHHSAPVIARLVNARALNVCPTLGRCTRCTIKRLAVELAKQERLAHVVRDDVLHAREIRDPARDPDAR